MWPADNRPRIVHTRDIDDWLTIIAAGGGVGITAEGTTAQYRRDGVVFRPLAIVLLSELYRTHSGTH
jgi:hypothetical protein